MLFRRLSLYAISIVLPLVVGGVTLWLEIAIVHSPVDKALVVFGCAAATMLCCLLSDILEMRNVHYQREMFARQRLQQLRSARADL